MRHLLQNETEEERILIKQRGFPRVLVINGEPFNRHTATGITLSNLFSGWPSEKIAQIYTARIRPDCSICRCNYRLTTSNLYPLSIFEVMRARVESASGDVSQSGQSGTRGAEMKGEVVSRAWTVKLRSLLVPLVDFLPYELPEEAWRLVRELRPQLVYTLLGNLRLTRLVQAISDELDLPVVPHFMDDWLSTYSVPGKSISTSLHRIIIGRSVRRLFFRAPIGLCIGRAMTAEYGRLFGLHFDEFMNPVAVPQLFPERGKGFDKARPVRFVYVGGLHLSRESGIREVAVALASLRDEGLEGELHVYAPTEDLSRYQDAILIDGVVRICGSITPEDVPAILLASDVAVHVESFLEGCARYTRLSVSTKIPQYFAAGLPVLAYGPSELASCQYIEDCKCGYVVGRRDPSLLRNSLRELIESSALRAEFGRRAWETARSSHEINSVRDRFRRTLVDAAAGVWPSYG